jgi:hypothetical protein
MHPPSLEAKTMISRPLHECKHDPQAPRQDATHQLTTNGIPNPLLHRQLELITIGAKPTNRQIHKAPNCNTFDANKSSTHS